MIIYPAIDIRDGKCVRLRQGAFDDICVYADDPAQIAKEWEEAGASYIHVVDLNGAQLGSPANIEAIRAITSAVKTPVQTGGGVRNIKDVEERLAAGVSRVIIGTRAVENPGFVRECVEKFSADRIVIGIDAKDGRVAIRGWEEISRVSALELAARVRDMGIRTIIYTDISKDGMLAGPNLESTSELIERSGLEIIASGGVSSMADLARLREIKAAGVILGKSLYEKRIALADAIREFEHGFGKEFA